MVRPGIMLLLIFLPSVSLYAQSAAQKALNAEPEMRQLRELTDEAHATRQLPDDQRPGGLYAAGQIAMAMQQQRHLMDVLEERLQKQAQNCHYCSAAQAELSELIRQRAQAKSAIGGVTSGSGMGAAGVNFMNAIMGVTPLEDRWKDLTFAENQASAVTVGCITGYRTPDNKVIPLCLDLNRDPAKLAQLHEVTWAKCFSSHNWVNTPAERVAYEACMDADDPLMKICHLEKRSDCTYSRVTGDDVAALTNYKDRWAAPAETAEQSAQIRASERSRSRLKPGSNFGICNTTDNLISAAFVYIDPVDNTLFHNEGGYLLGKGACKVFSIGASTLAYVSLLRSENNVFVPITSPLQRGFGAVVEDPPRMFCASKPGSKFSVVGTESKLSHCESGFVAQEYPYRWSPGERAPAEGKYAEFAFVLFREGPAGTVGNWSGWDEDYVPTASDLKRAAADPVVASPPAVAPATARTAPVTVDESHSSSVAKAVSPVPAQSPAIQPQDLTGSYSGTYICGGVKTPLQLTITVDAHSVLRAVFAAAIPGLPPYDLAGNFHPGPNQFFLNAIRWEGRPLPGYRMVGMRGNFEPHSSMLRGNITDPRCGEFSLQRAQ